MDNKINNQINTNIDTNSDLIESKHIMKEKIKKN